MEINKEPTASVNIERCGSLGLQEDPQTALGFPSIWNYCHKARPASPVALAYQRDFCQTASHRQCPLLQENARRRLPPEARIHTSIASSGILRGQGLGLIVLLLALLAGGALLAWLFNTGILQIRAAKASILLSPTETVTSTTPAGTATLPVAAAIASMPGSPLDAAEATASLSPSPDGALCGYQMDQTIHAERDFIIHRAAGGENLDQYASAHKTSVEAILAANYQLPVPLRIDWVIVIPVGTTDVQDLPPFEPYFQPAQGVPLSELASTLSIEEPVLRRYNGIGPECINLSGWLLVPRFPSSG